MTAPLSLFLTRFSAPVPPVVVELEPSEPTISLTQAELDARLEAAARTAASDARDRHAAEVAAMTLASEHRLAEALAGSRAAWAEAEGARLAALVEDRFVDLRTMIGDGLTAVLRPLLAEAARAATTDALSAALDRLLADPKKPTIRISGPADLLQALRGTRPDAGIEWVVAETVDVTIVTETTHVQTRLAAALTAIAATET